MRPPLLAKSWNLKNLMGCATTMEIPDLPPVCIVWLRDLTASLASSWSEEAPLHETPASAVIQAALLDVETSVQRQPTKSHQMHGFDFHIPCLPQWDIRAKPYECATGVCALWWGSTPPHGSHRLLPRSDPKSELPGHPRHSPLGTAMSDGRCSGHLHIAKGCQRQLRDRPWRYSDALLAIASKIDELNRSWPWASSLQLVYPGDVSTSRAHQRRQLHGMVSLEALHHSRLFANHPWTSHSRASKPQRACRPHRWYEASSSWDTGHAMPE